MASEKLKLFSKIEIEIISNVAGTLAILTDAPGNAMAQRFSFATPASSADGNGNCLRRTVTSRLPYNTQGHLIQAKLTPGSGQTSLYRARVWGRELPGGQWEWFALPVIETPVEFAPAALPIPPTAEEWRPEALPVPPTAEEWRPEALPVPPTAEEWRPEALPIPPTAEEWRPEALPIPPTAEEWRPSALPVKATPDVPDWAELEVDA